MGGKKKKYIYWDVRFFHGAIHCPKCILILISKNRKTAQPNHLIKTQTTSSVGDNFTACVNCICENTTHIQRQKATDRQTERGGSRELKWLCVLASVCERTECISLTESVVHQTGDVTDACRHGSKDTSRSQINAQIDLTCWKERRAANHHLSTPESAQQQTQHSTAILPSLEGYVRRRVSNIRISNIKYI